MNAIQVLLAKVDAVLREQGGDPDLVSQEDKLLLAAQCVEVTHSRGLMHAGAGIYRL